MSAAILYQRYKLSAEEYHRMGETGVLKEDSRIELIDGELVEMAPVGSPHASVVGKLARLLARQVPDERAIVWAQNPVSLPPRSEPQPDILVLRPRADDYFGVLPTAADVLLLVEVSDSSLGYDRSTKLTLYALHGIPECWIVDVQGRCLELYRAPASSGYATCARPAFAEGVSPNALPEVRISARQLFPASEG